MPYSEKTFDKRILEFLREHKARDYVDIGPGAGKYGKLICQAVPDTHIIAIEAHEPYIAKFNLPYFYNEIHGVRAEDFFFRPEQTDFQTDIVIMGDVIEHMRKSAGVDLINYFAYRSTFQIIVYPRRRLQFSVGGVKTEAHLSAWSEVDFENFDYKFESDGTTDLVILQGFGKEEK